MTYPYIETPSRRRRLFAGRGRTAHLPLYFAGSLLLATVLDIIGAIISLAAQPDDNVGAAATIVSAFMRPGMMAVVLIGVLVFAWLRADVLDERAASSGYEPLRGSRTPAATVAAILAIVGGVLVAILTVNLAVMLSAEAKQYPSEGQPSDAIVDLTLGGFAFAIVLILAIPVWLGIQVLRRRRWARYALIAFVTLAEVGVLMVPFLRNETMYSFVLVGIAALLIWAELRERSSLGSFRDSWRGIVQLAINLPFVISYVMIGMLADQDSEAGILVVLVSLGMTIYLVGALLFAMRALNRDVNDFWAGLNAIVVVSAPALYSLIGLITAIAMALPIFMGGN